MSAATAPQPAVQTALAQQRIAHLAAMLPVHRAFHWLHLHQPQLRQWQLEMLAIPAPPFAEHERAAWFLERFRDLGLSHVHVDEEGNALGELRPSGAPSGQPFLLLSAHLDTVFPVGTDTTPTEDGPRILCPGACDNAAGLTALLAMIAALRFASIEPPLPILFAANVGEEGEGDLRGMRHLFLRGAYSGRIAAAVAFEGSGTAVAVTRALGSRRFRITITAPGGHSWTDAGMPNPITLLARGLVALDHINLLPGTPNGPRTTLNPGQIKGGTSINSIPASASVTLDLRSTDAQTLDELALAIERVFRDVIHDENRRSLHSGAAQVKLEAIGERPAAALAAESPLLHSLRAVDRHLGLQSEFRLGSTDANLPLSLGIPALAIAAGGTGGGIHTLSEWYDPTGREIALRRSLLLSLDLAQVLARLPLEPDPSITLVS